LGKIVFMLVFVMGLLGIMIWGERKGAAFIQDRVGPNRASLGGVIRLGGMIHPLADVLKLIFKEDVVPAGVNRFFYTLAPFLVMVVSLCTFAILPFGDALYLGDRVIPLRIANLDVGILYLLAITSLGVYGIVLAGWASNNKYTFLGGIRATAQMISYELNMGLAVLALFLVYGSTRVDAMVVEQGQLLWGFLPRWGVVLQPLGFIIFLVAVFAETNRTPFDLAEGESELVSGYNLEYSSLKFALFFMAEYASMIISAGFIASLYFGGWQIPWLDTATLREHAPKLLTVTLSLGVLFNLLFAALLWRRFDKERGLLGDRRELEPLILGVVFFLLGMGCLGFLVLASPWALSAQGSANFATVAQVGSFILKTVFFSWLFIWVRWTLPRFRYDQLMNLGWKVMLPLGLLNFLVTAAAVLLARS
jgi:NADH-quinone oxidoreductase subunit H